jgi:peptidoglycan/LPS O-acetylase OafA/YrhL
MRIEVSKRPTNNFELLRLTFASAVVLSHSYALIGQPEPTLWGRSLGAVAVHAFFALSGYLVCESYLREPSAFAFTAKRFLRIAPALIVVLMITGLVGNFCQNFQTNPVPYIRNGPIWTLTWEALCYGALLVVGTLGILQANSLPAFFGACWLLFLVNTGNTTATYAAIVPMALMFLGGAFLRVMKDEFNLRRYAAIAAVCLAVLLSDQLYSSLCDIIQYNIVFLFAPSVSAAEVLQILYIFCFPFVVVWIGRDAPVLIDFKDDISYGIYIYAWLVAQCLIYFLSAEVFLVRGGPILLFFLTLLVTVPFAWLSWRLIEKPSLSLKSFLK